MKKFFFLLLVLFHHLSQSEMNAQTGWYQQVSGTEQALYGVHFSDVNTGTAVGTFGTILRTTDGGKTWAAQNSGTNSHFFDVTFFNSDTGIVVSIIGKILRTTNGGETWNNQTSEILPALFSVDFADEHNGTAVGHTGIMLRTTDGGITWVQQPDAPTSLRAIHFVDVNNGIAVGDNGLVMRTTDGGVSWVQQYSGIQINLHGVYFTDINTVTVVGGSNLTGAGIYKTTDSGITWTLQHSIPNEALSDVHFTDSQTGSAVGWNGIILNTTDGGATWINQTSNITNSLVSVFFVNSDVGFAVGGVGTILATIDGGIPVELSSFTANVNGNSVTLNWTTSSELNNRGFEIERFSGSWEKVGFVEGNGTTTEIQSYSFIDDLTLNYSHTPILSYRLKQIDFDESFKYSNVIEVEISAPVEFGLMQNYPNPFNPTTTISWQSPVGSWQTLKVYDLLGKEVATLVDEYRPAGSYKVEFDRSDLASGKYFYRLQSGEFAETRKFILLK
jgi:photosystem II stability/assembly factor-like uncharacterized protein